MLENLMNVNDKDLSADKKVFNQLMNATGEIFRKVKSRVTMRIESQNHHYYIKKYYPISLSEIIKNLVSLKWPFANAKNEYRAITAVKYLDIKTLDVAAYGLRKNILQSTSFVITKAIEPNIDLDKLAEKLIETKKYFKFKRWMLEFVAQTTRKLHLNGLNHRDYYICHYLLHLSEAQIREMIEDFNSAEGVDIAKNKTLLINNAYLIDLHRMQIRSKVPNRYLIKDLSAMLFSARNLEFTRTDYLRFIKIYMNLHDRKSCKEFFLKERKFLDNIVARASSTTEKG